MKASTRRWLLYGCLAAVVAWSVNLARNPSQQGSVIVAQSLPQKRFPQGELMVAAQAPSPVVSRLSGVVRRDLFAPKTFEAPKPIIAQPAVAPRAPPLPFQYVGRWQSKGKVTYYLVSAGQIFDARLGQVLPGSWRLDSAQGLILRFTYEPLKLSRSLSMGESIAVDQSPLARTAAGIH